MIWIAVLGGRPYEIAGQTDPNYRSLADANACRCRTITAGGYALGVSGALVVLDQAWYSGYARSPLHAFNDGDEWLQMDKAGHAFSGYTLSSIGHNLLDRCDPGKRSSLWIGAGAGMAFLTGVELLDGTSAEWGFSWWDMAANVTGVGLYVGQELLWREQRMRLKIAAHHTDYAALRPDLLGSGDLERLLKDYNGLTLWLSTTPASFMKSGKVPDWLALAVGVGAEGMITARAPEQVQDLGGGIERYRRFFISPDVDLTRIRTRSKFLRTTLFVLNSIKLPAPTLEYRGNGRWVGHLIYF